MNYTQTVVKALKALAFVLVGSFAASLLTPEFVSAAQAVVSVAAAKIPLVGGLVAASVNAAAIAFFAAVAHAIDNWRKHRLQDPLL